MNLSVAKSSASGADGPDPVKGMSRIKDVGLEPAKIDFKRKDFLARYGVKALFKVDLLGGFNKVSKNLRVMLGLLDTICHKPITFRRTLSLRNVRWLPVCLE